MSTSFSEPEIDELAAACEESSLFRAIVDISALLPPGELESFHRWLTLETHDVPPARSRGRLPALQRATMALRSRERELLCRSLLVAC